MAQPPINGSQVLETTLDLTGVDGSGLSGVDAVSLNGDIAGVGIGNLVKLVSVGSPASAGLPAIDGSLLTGLPASGIANVIEDTTPQLGGDLDVNGNNIVGAPAATATSTGGSIILAAADGGATSGGGGNVLLVGGNTTDGVGGSVGLTARASTSNLATGGSVSLTAGSAGTNGLGGPINIIAGAGNGTGKGGDIGITAGAAPGANSGGNLLLTAGDSSTGIGGDIELAVGNGTTQGSVELKSKSSVTIAPSLRFHEGAGNGTNYVALKTPNAITANRTWVLPIDDPSTSNGNFLTTDASGNLSFASVGPEFELQTSAAGSPLQTVFNTTVPTISNYAVTGKARLQVFVNGVLQLEDVPGSPVTTKDYSITGANQITFTTGVAANAAVAFYAF